MHNKQYYFLKVRNETFRYIYVICFNRFRFLAEVRTKSQKMHFEGNMGTRQMSPFLSLIFLLKLFVTFISEIENTQNSIPCGPTIAPFWSVKCLSFWPKATDSDSSSYFSRLTEATKNLYYVLTTRQSQISIFFRLQLMD